VLMWIKSDDIFFIPLPTGPGVEVPELQPLSTLDANQEARSTWGIIFITHATKLAIASKAFAKTQLWKS
jgi:hypothetical protein